ncbi:hypothetical protein BB559_001424 [Furculomyces boomerangus]|uniref:DH domain-containing protein n=2 Tax=Harpellales TaxID=61421 RepID=A0A2T9Z203_9FUNG|nr:hypothetical protein BB559_001424 [Furculomyces boomerangus]PWA03613.1 hypothetical protein BB558_000267 [Smittium angustum]
MSLNRGDISGNIEKIQSNNVILNRPAPTTSIYQKSLDLLDKLACIDGLEVYFEDLLTKGQEDEKISRPELYRDPMQLLWEILQQGVSLCVLYNALKPAQPLPVDLTPNSSLNARKKPVYAFLKACKDNNIVQSSDLFTITELFKDDTNSFVKVLKTVGIVIDEVESKGLLGSCKINPPPSNYFMDTHMKDPTDNRERLVREFLNTERKYVQDMETLQAYMVELQSKNIVSNNTLRCMFANLYQLVDFQRRFLIGIEANAPLPPNEQRFGALFASMEEGFSVYEPYCANYDRANQLTIAQGTALSKLGHIIEPHYELPSMLIKPIQRICKYPLLVKAMLKLTDKESPAYTDLEEGYLISTRITDRVNDARNREMNMDVVRSLEERIDDWKGYSLATFGELCLHDSFVMSTSNTSRELQIYLFEKILICCKEITDRDRRKSKGNPVHSSGPNGTIGSSAGKGSLKLIGRIFLHSIHRVSNSTKLNVPMLTVYWRDIFLESFNLKCRSEDQLVKWKTTIEKLISVNKEKNIRSRDIDSDQTLNQNNVSPSNNPSSHLESYESDEDQTKNLGLINGAMNRLSEGVLLNHAKSNSYDLANRKTFDTYESSSKLGFKNHGMMGLPPVPNQVTPGEFSNDYLGSNGQQRLPFLSRTMSNASDTSQSEYTMYSAQIPTITEGENGRSIVPNQQTNRPFKIKVHFGSDIYVLAVKSNISFMSLLDKVERKVKLCAAPNLILTSSNTTQNTGSSLGIRMRYMDEDGDLVLVAGDEDVQLAFESASMAIRENSHSTMITLNLYVALP